MKKLLVVVIALAFVAGAAYAADQAKKIAEPVSTVVTSTGTTVHNVAEGTAETLDLNKNPVVTVTKTTKNVVEDTAKTVTFQKVDKKKQINASTTSGN